MGAGDEARRYHRATDQRPGGRPRPDVAGFVPMDPRNRPRPFKRYPEARRHALPTDLPPAGAPATAALSGHGPSAGGAVDLDRLARLLFYSAGVTRVAPGRGDPIFFRAAGSAGNLHPLELYVATGGLPGLDAGLYHFAPDAFCLEELSTGDCRSAVADAVADPQLAASPLAVVVTGIPWRTAWKYAERGWRHVYWDAGTLLASLLAVAEGHGLPANVLLGFVDAALCHRLGIDGVAEFPVAVIAVGAPAAPPAPPALPAPGACPEPGLAATALSAAPMEFPMITRVQRAGNLATAEQVAAWRRVVAADLPGAADRADPPPIAGRESIEAVVLRRGSTRQMRPGVPPAEVLRWPMAAATRHVPADAIPAGASLLRHELSVHAVQAVRPGLYHWVEGAPRPYRPMPEADVRALSRRLCMDQPLGGDSAYTDFACADLDQVLDAYGDRGYRVAQLEAGVAAGRLQLAAFALDHGGTGLTFYDEEIPAAFGTPATCLLATSIGMPAYRTRPGGPPGRPTRLAR